MQTQILIIVTLISLYLCKSTAYFKKAGDLHTTIEFCLNNRTNIMHQNLFFVNNNKSANLMKKPSKWHLELQFKWTPRYSKQDTSQYIWLCVLCLVKTSIQSQISYLNMVKRKKRLSTYSDFISRKILRFNPLEKTSIDSGLYYIDDV